MNMEKSELVIELGVEEIPASILEDATHQFAEIIGESLNSHRLSAGKCTKWYTPRRIIVGFDDIPMRQKDLIETITGPPKRVAYDPEGSPGKAAMAFESRSRSSFFIFPSPKTLDFSLPVVYTTSGIESRGIA